MYLQLHKLSAINSEETLDHILTTLWKTRRKGLRSPEKSHFQSLLNLPSVGELDPVLACLRSLIRKCVHENFTGDDLLKLFPPDLPLELQSMLILMLQKYQNQWKEEMSGEQYLLPRTSISYQVKTIGPPSFSSFPYSEMSTSSWPNQDGSIGCLSPNNLGLSAPSTTNVAGSCLGSISLQHDVGPPNNLGILPRLKSMTWVMENCKSSPANRVAIVTLKLQDYPKSPSGETEVKFQLTRDTLEAMLRSMTYISEQLSNVAGTSSGPLQKKPRQ